MTHDVIEGTIRANLAEWPWSPSKKLNTVRPEACTR